MNNMAKETRVFALRHGNEVFVGRSRADKLSAVVYKHLRGKHLQTKNHFDKTKRRPEFHILESVTGPSAEGSAAVPVSPLHTLVIPRSDRPSQRLT